MHRALFHYTTNNSWQRSWQPGEGRLDAGCGHPEPFGNFCRPKVNTRSQYRGANSWVGWVSKLPYKILPSYCRKGRCIPSGSVEVIQHIVVHIDERLGTAIAVRTSSFRFPDRRQNQQRPLIAVCSCMRSIGRGLRGCRYTLDLQFEGICAPCCISHFQR